MTEKGVMQYMVFNDTIKVDLHRPLVRTRAVLSSGDDNANSFGASLKLSVLQAAW